MLGLTRIFADDETGVVTVDWVVLTAAVVVLGVSAVSLVGEGTEALEGDIGAAVAVSNGN